MPSVCVPSSSTDSKRKSRSVFSASQGIENRAGVWQEVAPVLGVAHLVGQSACLLTGGVEDRIAYRRARRRIRREVDEVRPRRSRAGAVDDRQLERRVRGQEVVRGAVAGVLRHKYELVVVAEGELGLSAVLGQDELAVGDDRSEEHTSELQSLAYLVCRLLLEKKKKKNHRQAIVYRA